MKSTNIEIDSLDILQELFGINDKLIKVIENRLGVSITQRNSCITVSGTNDGRIHSAVNIIEAMKEALEKQQQLSVDMIHRFLDETEEEDDSEEDIADSTRKVLGDAVTLNYKNIPIRTKTIGQKNYITALKNNTVTVSDLPVQVKHTWQLLMRQSCTGMTRLRESFSAVRPLKRARSLVSSREIYRRRLILI